MDFLLNISPREYQKAIFETAKDKNTLVVLPTGIGKTLIALLLSIERLKKHPATKVLFLAPTRPLVEQHIEYFKKHLPELFADLQLFTGQIEAGKRKKIWQTAEIIFSTPQCVDGETQIFTEEGPIRISEFFKKFNFEEENYTDGKREVAKINEKVLGYDGQKIDFLKASRAWKRIAEGLISIKTEIGNTLLCTKDHPLLTINPFGELIWKKASDLNEEDYIASSKEISIEEKSINLPQILSNAGCKIADKLVIKNLIQKLKEKKIKTSRYSRYLYNFMPLKLFLELAKIVDLDYKKLILTDASGKSNPIKIPEQITPKLSYIIGAMLGDGHIGNRKNHGREVVFSDLDRESVSNYLKKSIKEVFGIEMRKDETKGLVAYNSALASALISLGIPAGNKSKTIRVPSFLFFSDIETTKGFIKGIFDTEGNASKYGISISSVSKKFIEDLKWLFLKIGILGSIEKRVVKQGIINERIIKESELFTFRFSGRKNLEKFLEVCPNENKCQILKETLKNARKPNTRSKEILPIPELMKKIRKENTDKAEYYKFSCLSKDNLRNLSRNLEGRNALKLRNLLDMPIRWAKIIEKKEIDGKKEVYDLTIEKNHNFVTNWLISHNCVANDLGNYLYNLNDVSLLIIDEAHRCLKNYDYTKVVKFYKEQATNQRILGLTASPGHDPDKVKQITSHLNLDEIEIRTRESDDVKPYVKERKYTKVEVPFPPELMEIHALLNKMYNEAIEKLKSKRYIAGPVNKVTLLKLQTRLFQQLSGRNFAAFYGVSLCAQAIKLSHALELLETQTLSGLHNYMKTIFEQAKENKSKAVQAIVKSPEFNKAHLLIEMLLAKKAEHPKIFEIIKIINSEFSQNPRAKIIVFAQFRETVHSISKKLNENPSIKSAVFIGQAKKSASGGLTQKEQREIIEKFKTGELNVICATSIGEEGLDIPEVNAVIFYEPIPSAIRKIQRAGRTARLQPGKLIILVTMNTRDEIHHYASSARERKMHRVIDGVKKDLKHGTKTLDKFKTF